VGGDFEHPFAGNISAAKHVFEKREDVVHFLGPAESDDEDRIVGKLW
jgi:hypothetical protein